MMRYSRSIQIALIDLYFLVSLAKSFQKMHYFFGNLGTVTQEGKKESRQMIPYFHLIFEL